MAALGYIAESRGVAAVETGFIDDIVKGVSKIADTIGGGPQKRRREAAEKRKLVEAEIALVQAQQAQAPSVPAASAASGPGFFQRKTGPLPNWAWVGLGVAAVVGVGLAVK